MFSIGTYLVSQSFKLFFKFLPDEALSSNLCWVVLPRLYQMSCLTSSIESCSTTCVSSFPPQSVWMLTQINFITHSFCILFLKHGSTGQMRICSVYGWGSVCVLRHVERLQEKVPRCQTAKCPGYLPMQFVWLVPELWLMLQVCETAGLLLETWKDGFASAQGAGSASQALCSCIWQRSLCRVGIPWFSEPVLPVSLRPV